MWIFVVISVVGVLGLFFCLLFIRNLLVQNDELVDFVERALVQASATLDHMRALDNGGAFEADDEVGQIFRQLRDAIVDYVVFLGIEEWGKTERAEEKK